MCLFFSLLLHCGLSCPFTVSKNLSNGWIQEFIIYRGRESIQHCITWSKCTVFKDCATDISTKTYLNNTERVSILLKQSTTNAFLYNKSTPFQHLSMHFSGQSHMMNMYWITLKYLWFDTIFDCSGFDWVIQPSQNSVGYSELLTQLERLSC